jgi:hypothetical protein
MIPNIDLRLFFIPQMLRLFSKGFTCGQTCILDRLQWRQCEIHGRKGKSLMGSMKTPQEANVQVKNMMKAWTRTLE